MNERFAVLRTVTGMVSSAFTTPAGMLKTTPSGLIAGSAYAWECLRRSPTGDSTFSSYLCPACGVNSKRPMPWFNSGVFSLASVSTVTPMRLAVFEQLALEIGRLAERAAHLEIHAVAQPRHEIAAFGTKLDIQFFQHDRDGPNDRVGHGPIVELDRHRPQAALDLAEAA